jgi:hypothetical protein
LLFGDKQFSITDVSSIHQNYSIKGYIRLSDIQFCLQRKPRKWSDTKSTCGESSWSKTRSQSANFDLSTVVESVKPLESPMANGKRALQRMSARDRAAQHASKAPNNSRVLRSARGRGKGQQDIQDEARLSIEPGVPRGDDPYEEKAASDMTREEAGSTKTDGEVSIRVSL